MRVRETKNNEHLCSCVCKKIAWGVVTTGTWLSSFPELKRIRDRDWLDARNRVQTKSLSAGAHLYRLGDKCNHYVLLSAGCVRVSRTSRTGREIVLYRLEVGQSCLLSTAILFSGGRFPADAVAEEDTDVALLSAESFQLAFECSPGFRQFVCTDFGKRILENVVLLKHMAFSRVDMRLAQVLLSHASGDSTPIDISHRELARELGTAREVVTRQLKAFEGSEWVRLGRREIHVIDRLALKALISRGRK